jgi:hypothetical protein
MVDGVLDAASVTDCVEWYVTPGGNAETAGVFIIDCAIAE